MSDNTLFHVHVTVHAPQCSFEGRLDADPLSKEDALHLADQVRIHGLNSLSLIDLKDENLFTVFTKPVLDLSVMRFQLVPAG